MEINTDILNELKKIIPNIPDSVIKLVLTLEVDTVPTIEITSYVFESQLLPPETKVKTFKLTDMDE